MLRRIRLNQDFNILILVSIDSNKINTLDKTLSSYADLDVSIKKTSNTGLEKNTDYIFILKGADTEGIVHQCTHLFPNLNINIIDLETKLINAPITGTPLFYIKSIVSVPQNVSISKIKDQIINLENTSNVKIKFTHYDPNY